MTEEYIDKVIEEQRPIYESLPEILRREAENLTETILEIPGEIMLNFHCQKVRQTLNLRTAYRKKNGPQVSALVLYACATMINDRGYLFIEQFFKDSSQCFGVDIMPVGIWRCLPARDVRCIAATECRHPEWFESGKAVFKTLERERF